MKNTLIILLLLITAAFSGFYSVKQIEFSARNDSYLEGFVRENVNKENALNLARILVEKFKESPEKVKEVFNKLGYKEDVEKAIREVVKQNRAVKSDKDVFIYVDEEEVVLKNDNNHPILLVPPGNIIGISSSQPIVK